MKAPIAIAAGLIIGVGLTAGVGAALGDSDETATAETSTALSTATVTKQDIILTDETTATLEFVDSATVTAPTSGTITSTVAEGSTIEAGTVVATIDSAPVVALFGDVPAYRDLDTSSDDGVDIYQLEANLVALGFDPDGTIEIDRGYDSSTAAAVELWQTSLGLDADGAVPQSLVTYIPGVLLVEGAPAGIGTGVQDGGQLASGRVLERAFIVPTTVEDRGEISSIAAVDTPVTTGTLLFIDGTTPVIAVQGDVAASPVLERDLSIASTDGSDIRQLEQALLALGFEAGGDLVVDEDFDAATSQAVYDWYTSLGVLADGFEATSMTIPAGSFVVVPPGLIVGTTAVAEGTTPVGEAPVLHLTTAPRLVTTSAPIGDSSFELGATVEVEYPDGTLASGTVTEVGTTATDVDGTATVPVSITPSEVPDSVLGFVQVPVTLRVVTETITEAYVVPVSSLLALAEGGYAIEVVADGTTSLIAVEPGTYSSGFVEVTGNDVSSGLTIVVPT